MLCRLFKQEWNLEIKTEQELDDKQRKGKRIQNLTPYIEEGESCQKPFDIQV